MTAEIQLPKDILAKIEKAKAAAQAYYFDNEVNSAHHVTFETRDNGDVGEETPGQADVQTGIRLQKALKTEFPDAEVTFETIDEWVHVDLKLPTPKLREIQDFKPLENILSDLFAQLGQPACRNQWHTFTSHKKIELHNEIELCSVYDRTLQIQSQVSCQICVSPEKELATFLIGNEKSPEIELLPGPLENNIPNLKKTLESLLAQGREKKTLRPDLLTKIQDPQPLPAEAKLVGHFGFESPNEWEPCYLLPNGDIVFLNTEVKTQHLTKAPHIAEVFKYLPDFFPIEGKKLKSLRQIAQEEGHKLSQKILEEAKAKTKTTLEALGYKGEIVTAITGEPFLQE